MRKISVIRIIRATINNRRQQKHLSCCLPINAKVKIPVTFWPQPVLFCYIRPATRGLTMTDTEQFEVFMRNYQNMVFSTAIRLLANESEAQDISQEVFLKAFERFGDLRNSPTVGGWLKTVTTNL